MKPHLNAIIQHKDNLYWACSSIWKQNDAQFILVEVAKAKIDFEIIHNVKGNIKTMFIKSHSNIVSLSTSNKNTLSGQSIDSNNLSALNQLKIIQTFNGLITEKESNEINLFITKLWASKY